MGRWAFGLWVVFPVLSDCVRGVLAGAQWFHAGTDDASRRTEQHGRKMMRGMKHMPCLRKCLERSTIRLDGKNGVANCYTAVMCNIMDLALLKSGADGGRMR